VCVGSGIGDAVVGVLATRGCVVRGPSSSGAAPGSGNGTTRSGTTDPLGSTVDGAGGIAGGIAISTVSSSESVDADGNTRVAVVSSVSRPTVNVTVGTEIVRLRAGSESDDVAGVDGTVVVVAVAPGAGRVVASGGACWGADEAGSLAAPAPAAPHDQTHVQSQVHVSGAPAPACVESVVVLPQNVKVHVQFQGSAGAAVGPEALSGTAAGGALRSPLGGERSLVEAFSGPGDSDRGSEHPHSHAHSHDHSSDFGSPVSSDEEVAFPSQSRVKVHFQFQSAEPLLESD
jgi:hypothetical protein